MFRYIYLNLFVFYPCVRGIPWTFEIVAAISFSCKMYIIGDFGQSLDWSTNWGRFRLRVDKHVFAMFRYILIHIRKNSSYWFFLIIYALISNHLLKAILLVYNVNMWSVMTLPCKWRYNVNVSKTSLLSTSCQILNWDHTNIFLWKIVNAFLA